MSDEFLFVYGTLRKDYGKVRLQILREQATYRGEAYYRGRMYLVGRFPGVIPSDDPKDRVAGDLYRLDDPDAVFAELDPYEGVNPRDPTAGLFTRKKVTVDKGGREVESWIYLYNRDLGNAREIPSGDFLSFME